MVISSDGYFYSYSIDLERGGECSLLKQYRYIYLTIFLFSTSHLFCYNSLLDSGDESDGSDVKYGSDRKYGSGGKSGGKSIGTTDGDGK